MAKNRLLIASLVLCYVVQHTTCSCNITCTTDYETSLNCSCPGMMAPRLVLVEAECRDYEGQMNGSCAITPSQNWCIIQPEDFWQFTSVTTNCTARVKHAGRKKTEMDESTNWVLYKSAKPRPPFNVQVTQRADVFNITWETHENIYLESSIRYIVHIARENITPKTYLLNDYQKYLVLDNLQPVKQFVAKVQASNTESGHPSEWSATVEWRTKEWRSAGWSDSRLLLLLPCLFLCSYALYRLVWPKRQHFMRYTPNPEDFFKPLYHTYEGDFKKWVGPVYIFSELELLGKNPPAKMMTVKQLDVLVSRLSVEEDCSSDNSTDRDTCHSAGHISIDTVMVSGEEGPVSGSSWETYGNRRGGGIFYPDTGSSGGDTHRELGDPLGSGADEDVSSSGRSGSQEWQLQVHARDYGPEQISLDSEDGYPPVGLDLDSVDTIDSGVFVESNCSSPVTLNFDPEEEKNSLLNGVDVVHSNYVKQWVTDDSVQTDPANS